MTTCSPVIFLFDDRFRLTPVYAVILGFYATFLVYASTGPNWFTITELSNDCRVAWWKHLLYSMNHLQVICNVV